MAVNGKFYDLVVRLAVELGALKSGMDAGAATVTAGADKITDAAGKATGALDKLDDALNNPVQTSGSLVSAAAGVSGGAAVMAAALGTAAAAAGALATAHIAASREAERQANALTLTGNAAGLVAGELNALARSSAAQINGQMGNVRGVMEALVASGRVSREALGEMAKSVELVAQFSGKSREQVTSDFADMASGVTKWATKHNEQYHFIDLATLKYIESLEKAGQTQEAMRVTSEALNRHLGGDLQQNLGTLQRLWAGVQNWASRAWDAMLNIGRDSSISDRLEQQRRTVAALEGTSDYANSPGLLRGALGAVLRVLVHLPFRAQLGRRAQERQPVAGVGHHAGLRASGHRPGHRWRLDARRAHWDDG